MYKHIYTQMCIFICIYLYTCTYDMYTDTPFKQPCSLSLYIYIREREMYTYREMYAGAYI